MGSVFFSYSHKDEGLRDQLETHLALLKNQGLIDAWYDRRIVAGDEVDEAIMSQLESADIILLLVSSDFISSPYCYSREMRRAMDRHDAGEARVIPVILRHCDWHSAPFGKLLAAPRDGKPITSWPDRDEAFADVAKQVRRAVEATAGKKQGQPALEARPRPPAHTPNGSTPKVELPRSSNLRLKKEFTDQDRDEFLRSGFEFICRFFEGSTTAVVERSPDVKGHFERVDSRRMAAMLYRNGKTIAQCSIRLDGLGGRSNGIAYSQDPSANHGAFNEFLNVETTDQSLYFKALGLAWNRGDRERHLSQEGAAEFFWEMFIKSAQS